MKKSLILLLLVLLILPSCMKKESESVDGLKIVAVDFPSYDAARAILGSADEVSLLLPPGVESHSYEPTPKDMITISEADLVIFTGGESDSWVYKILDSGDSKAERFVLMDQVDLCIEDHDHEHNHDEHEHEHDEAYDEHVWTSPINEIRILNHLIDILSELDPSRKDIFSSNGATYIAQIEELDCEIRDIIESAENKTMVFASRFPLKYFAEEYGIDYHAAFPGCAEETEPSARTIASLIDIVRDENLGYVFTIEFGSPMIASVIADESNAGVREFHTIHNLTSSDFKNGETYVSLMERNLEVLREVFL